MASFCSAGDTARVTLPDGSIQEFSDTPVSIECKPVYGLQCDYLTVGLGYPGRYDWYVNGVIGELIDVYPLDGWRFGDTYAIYRGDRSSGFRCGNLQERGLIYNPYGYYVTSYIVYSHTRGIWIKSDTADNPDGYQLKIIGNSGLILLSNTYTSCGYSVECIHPCPPNTLDCGDCCLDCVSTFNQISAIRSLLSRIK